MNFQLHSKEFSKIALRAKLTQKLRRSIPLHANKDAVDGWDGEDAAVIWESQHQKLVGDGWEKARGDDDAEIPIAVDVDRANRCLLGGFV